MSRAAEHRFWGIAAGVGTAAVFMPKDNFLGGVVELIGAAIGGRIGGAAADWLEPAVSPHHRGIAHSGVAAAGLIGLATVNHAKKCRENAASCRERAALAQTENERSNLGLEELGWRFLAGLILGFLAGYGSHLVLDSQTPHGLPLLGLS